MCDDDNKGVSVGCDDPRGNHNSPSMMQEDELSFKEGDRMVVIGESEDDGW